MTNSKPKGTAVRGSKRLNTSKGKLRPNLPNPALYPTLQNRLYFNRQCHLVFFWAILAPLLTLASAIVGGVILGANW